MDSLLATYASSDEEEAQQQHQNRAPKASSLFSSLPKPKPPLQNPNTTKPSSSFFSSLPQPKTLSQQQKPISNPKTIIQFKAPINPNFDDDDEEEEIERKKPKETESLTVTSFLSTIPAPRNSSLGSGSGRRSILETETPVSTSSAVNIQNVADYVTYDSNYPNYETSGDQNVGNYVNYASYDQNVSSGYENYGDYGNNWGDGSASMVPQTTTAAAAVVSDSVVRVPGKKRRNEIPLEIIEVKQDDLMKDRPREDQVKSTGIAFGPSYQPVSTKGKPTKLHKRKHQIGTLYYDMKQKEMELSERRSKGFLTKAETQAKYGW